MPKIINIGHFYEAIQKIKVARFLWTTAYLVIDCQ